MIHRLIRWGLGIHGVIHVGEFAANILEKAWVSASLSILAAAIMLGGAFIDYDHHKEVPDG